MTKCEDWPVLPTDVEMAWASKDREEAEAALRNTLFCGDLHGPSRSQERERMSAAFARLFLAWNGVKP